MNKKWTINNQTKLNKKWTKNEQKMNKKWTFLVTVRFVHFLYIFEKWTLYEQCTWSVHGVQRTFYEHKSNKKWTENEQTYKKRINRRFLNVLWTNFGWAKNEQKTNKRTFHERFVNVFWTFFVQTYKKRTCTFVRFLGYTNTKEPKNELKMKGKWTKNEQMKI